MKYLSLRKRAIYPAALQRKILYQGNPHIVGSPVTFFPEGYVYDEYGILEIQFDSLGEQTAGVTFSADFCSYLKLRLNISMATANPNNNAVHFYVRFETADDSYDINIPYVGDTVLTNYDINIPFNHLNTGLRLSVCLKQKPGYTLYTANAYITKIELIK